MKIASFRLSCLVLSIFAACAHTATGVSSEAACKHVEQAWPRVVSDTEASLRAADEAAFKADLAKVEGELNDPLFDQCPSWAEVIKMQRATLGEFAQVYSIAHAADDGHDDSASYGGKSKDELVAGYVQMHDAACTDASTHMGASWEAWHAANNANVPVNQRPQRYLANMERDNYLVRVDGSLGVPKSPNDFVALVQTPVLETLAPSFGSLQGQGPMVPQEANAYVGAAMHYAAAHHIGRVAFVNTAGGQVPSFDAQVKALSRATGVQGTYIDYEGWRDGTLVKPADAMAFASKIAEQFDPETDPHHTPTLLVVNCNAGMDRSGTINVLVQLILQARHDLAKGVHASEARASGFASIPTIVHNIKIARPRAISSVPRYLFIYRAYEAYWDSQHALR